MKCPICNKRDVTPGHIMGHSSWKNPSEAQREASRTNGKLGGRPKKKNDLKRLIEIDKLIEKQMKKSSSK